MKLSADDRRRLNELAEEMASILGGSRNSDGQAKTFAELEDECIEATDLLAAATLQLRVQDTPSPEDNCQCPSCRRSCQRKCEDEPRVLQTDRGEVQWLEPEYYCRHCRRSFFPSVE